MGGSEVYFVSLSVIVIVPPHVPAYLRLNQIMECLDFLEFQDVLKKMRDVDDKIVYALNASVPSPSFRNEVNPTASCKELYERLRESYVKRDQAIRNCITVTDQKIVDLKKQKESGVDGSAKALSKEHTKLRLLRSELGVEEVVRDRTLKLYYERCRSFFKPSNIGLNLE